MIPYQQCLVKTRFDLELYKVDVKTAVLSAQLLEEVYMSLPEDFEIEEKKHMVCKFNLKQASRQWF